ncbi:hypothetical protein ACJMK2_024797 [Sinanodonta woodiana]|uniref:Uncharacterized protein n=1 Tax=Sinanodonta woodiana TaxID=1069815 RepID=A0ABD3XIB7_SINWO
MYYIESTKKYAFDDSVKGTVVASTPYSRQFFIYYTVEELVNYKLYEIYKRLYDAYCAIGRPREFHYYMHLFENVCDRYCQESAYRFLAELWSYYNDQHRASITWTKCQSLRR